MFLRDSAESETLTSRLVMKRGGSGVVVEEINRPRPPRSPLLLLPRDVERVRQEHGRDPRRVSVGTRRSTPDRCRDRSVGDGMNGMNARGACVAEGWEYDKYSVSTHHTATSVTPDCSKDSLLKSRLGDLGPRSARRDLVEGRVRNLTPHARGTPRVATFGSRDRCAPVKGRARSVTRGRRGDYFRGAGELGRGKEA